MIVIVIPYNCRSNVEKKLQLKREKAFKEEDYNLLVQFIQTNSVTLNGQIHKAWFVLFLLKPFI